MESSAGPASLWLRSQLGQLSVVRAHTASEGSRLPPARASWPGPPSSGSSGQKDGELCTGTSDWLAGAELRELASAVPSCLQRLLLFTLENLPVFVF